MDTTQFFGDVAMSELSNGHAIYSFKDTTQIKGETAVSTVRIDTKEKTGLLASWGTLNDYPQKVAAAVKKNASASRALSLNIAAHYGNGVILMQEGEADENGKKTPKLLNLSTYADIQAFFNKNQMTRFTKEIITDLEWWAIAFPEYILSNDYNKITRVKRHPAAWCRFEAMDPKTGLIGNLYISQKFGLSSVNLDSEFVATVPLIDSYWSPEEVKAYCIANKIKKFVRPVFYPMLDEAYYPEASWHSVTKSGWLEIANSIPEYKKAIFNNQVSIKYMIEVDERYFHNVHGKTDWEGMDVSIRINHRKVLIDAINDHLGGNTNAGKSIQSMMFLDDNGLQVSAIKITAIDDKLKEGVYLPEASAANSEILVAHGIHATLIGGAGIPGGKMGAGSGSDIREAFYMLSALKRFSRDTTLEPLEFTHQYNEWPVEVKYNLENTVLTTLDKNPTGTKTAVA